MRSRKITPPANPEARLTGFMTFYFRWQSTPKSQLGFHLPPPKDEMQSPHLTVFQEKEAFQGESYLLIN
jgi:hypothetical protein